MKFAILFEDDPKADPDIRKRLMPDHLAFLKKHSSCVEAAGPLRTGDGSPAGGLWVVEAEDALTVETLVHKDPFWPTGLRKSFEIREWTQVFAAGRVSG